MLSSIKLKLEVCPLVTSSIEFLLVMQVKLHFQERRDCDVRDPMFLRCLLLGCNEFLMVSDCDCSIQESC